METPGELQQRLNQQGIEVSDEAARSVVCYVAAQRRVLAEVCHRLSQDSDAE